MSSDNIKELPNHIYAARLKDVYWNNNSDLYPTNVPETELYDIIDETTPVFHTAYSGTCVLDGDYNHAIYNGKYYFLKKLDPIDLTTDTFKYQLDEDIMLNLLNAGCNITGTLIRTNREDILKDCIQTCVPILNNPTRRFILSSTTEEKDWKKSLDTSWMLHPICTKGVFISTEEFNRFINDITNSPITRWWQTKDWQDNIKNGLNYNTNEQLIVFQTLNPQFGEIAWKKQVYQDVFDFCFEIYRNKENSDKIIVTQTDISDQPKLSGKYTITYKDDGLGGNLEQNVNIKKINLESVSDIVTINRSGDVTQSFQQPFTKTSLVKTAFSGIRDKRIRKLCRVPRLPWVGAQTTSEWKDLLSNSSLTNAQRSSTANLSITEEVQGYSGNQPQILEYKDGSKGWTWFVSQLDFTIVEGFHWEYWSDKFRKDDPLLFKWLRFGYPDSKLESISRYYFYRPEIPRSKFPPLGFQIFGLLKNPEEWDGVLYKGVSKPPIYINGIKQDTRDYSVPDKMKYIAGNLATSSIMVKLDGINWLHILPGEKKTYKYFFDQYWHQWQFHSPSERQNTNIKALPSLVSWGYTALGNRWEPLTNKEELDKVNKRRYEQAKEIFITKAVSQYPVGTNTIYFLSNEHRLAVTEFMWHTMPWWIGTNEFKNLPENKIELVEYTDIFKVERMFSRSTISALTEPVESGEDTGLNIKYMDILNTIKEQELGLREVFNELADRSQVKTYDFSSVNIEPTQIEDETETFVWQLFPARRTRLRNTMRTFGDFFYVKEDPLKTALRKKRIVAYFFKKNLYIGLLTETNIFLTLDNTNKDQKLERVDGSDHTTLLETTIKGLVSYSKNEFSGAKLSNEVDKWIDWCKFITLEVPIQNKLHLVDDSSENISPVDFHNKNKSFIFDLVGSNWYAVYKKGKVHLVAKDNNDTETFSVDKESKKYTIDVKTPANTIYEQINQKSHLVLYGKERQLNKKFLNGEKLEVSTRPVVVTDTETEAEFYNISVDNGVDFINDWIQTYKTVKKGDKLLGAEYELLKLQIEKNDLEYLQYQQQNELALKRQQTTHFRGHQDLDHKYQDAIAQTSLGAVGAAVGVVSSIASGNPIGAVGGLIAGGASMRAGITFMSRDYQKLKGRLDEDNRMFLEQNSMSLLHRKQNYEHNHKRQQIQLNSLNNTYIKPNVNDAVVQRQYNKDNGWTEIQLQVFIPNQHQLRKITHIYKTYGCECQSSAYETEPLQIKNNMTEGLYQFSELQPNSIECHLTQDPFINTIVRNIFETGVKFKKTNHIRTQQIKHEIEVIKHVFDTSKIPVWARQIWETYVLETPKDQILTVLKGFDKLGLTQQEFDANKALIDAARNDDNKLFEVINKIISSRQSGIVPILVPDKSVDEQLTELKKQCQLDKDKLEECQRQKEELETQRQEIIKQKDFQDKINKNLVDEIAKVKRSKEEIEENNRQCQIDLKNVQQAKETCDRINAAEQKKLKAEIGTLKQQLAEKTRERDELQTEKDKLTTDLQTCTTDKTTLQQNLDTKTQELTQCQTSLNNIQQQLNTKTEELRQCQINLTNLNQAKEACDRINAEEQKRLKAQLAECQRTKNEGGVPNACELLHRYLKEAYPINNRQTDQGSYAEFLLLKLAENIHNVQISHLNERLDKYPLVRKIFPLLNELEEAKAIGIYLDAMSLSGWDSYMAWKYKKQSWKSEAGEVLDLVNNVQDNLTPIQLIGVKGILDEIAFLAYEAKIEHEKKNKKDPDNEHRDVSDIDLDSNLRFFFTSVVGNFKTEYKNLYNEDIDIAIRKRIFLKSPCVEGGGTPAIVHLDNTDKQTTFTTQEIPVETHIPGTHKYPKEWTTYKGDTIPVRAIKDIIPTIVDNRTFQTIQNKTIATLTIPARNILTFTTYKGGYKSQGKNYTWFKVKLKDKMRFHPEDSNFGFYIRKDYTDTTYDKAHNLRNNILKKFHNRLDQENLRQFINTAEKVEINVNWQEFQTGSQTHSDTVYVTNMSTKIDLIYVFGREDTYYALFILLILARYKVVNFSTTHSEPKFRGVYYATVFNYLPWSSADEGYERINESITTHFENHANLSNYNLHLGLWALGDIFQYVSLTIKKKAFLDLYASNETGSLRWLFANAPA